MYERRVSSGVDELLSSMAAVMIQVDPGDGINYIEELTIMGPYRFHSAHVDATHKVYVLKNSTAATRRFSRLRAFGSRLHG